jgi:hypothetical protein
MLLSFTCLIPPPADAPLRLDGHAIAYRRDAGPYVWNAVDGHDAIGATSYTAVDAAGAVVFYRAPESGDPIRQEHRGDHLAFSGLTFDAVYQHAHHAQRSFFPEHRVVSHSIDVFHERSPEIK